MRNLAFVFLFLAPLASAAEIDCNNISTQAELNRCTAISYLHSDTLLNEVYRQEMSQLSPEKQQKFKLAQRDWIAFRDTDCAFQSSGYEGGSAQAMYHSQCLKSKTDRRIEEIKNLIDCKEGDLACP